MAEEDKEIRSLDDGIRRFRDQCANQPLSKWPAARVMIATAVEALTKRIEGRVKEREEGRGFRGAAHWGPLLMYLEPETVAVATIIATLDQFATMQDAVSMPQIRHNIAVRVQQEAHFAELKGKHPRLVAVMERRLKRWDRRTIRKARRAVADLTDTDWPTQMRQAIGHILSIEAIEHSGIFENCLVRRRGNRMSYSVRLTAEARAILNQMNDHLELLSPMYKPMLCPPNDWAPGERGGYILLGRYHRLVKSGHDMPDEMPDDHGPLVYDGVNNLQRTAWRVNPTVLRTMQRVWDLGGGFAGIPDSEDHVVPERWVDAEGDDLEWRTQAERVHRTNARLVGKRLAFMQCLAVAHEYSRAVFYYPYQCDFRGRIYPIPQYLQPQGNDVARGLLTFADPVPLGKEGLYWLRVQYANCHGVDKVSFGERVGWANDVLHDVVEWACTHDPEGWEPWDWKELWAEADDPWQALATLTEIVYAFSYGDPTAYPCSLPVNVDGSNSGLQHFSAMLRDEEGARLVNLTPAEQPSDIYSDVAKVVDRAVREDQASPDEVTQAHANGWLAQGIDRKLCKRGTMTYCYGVTPQGLKEALISDGFVDWADHQYAATAYIGKHIWAGIQQCITGATEAMDWLKACASCANKAGVLLEWLTPSGFHVIHPYNEPKTERLQLTAGDVWFKVYNPDAEVSAHKQRNSLPPNFVHSLDASHLLMTVSAGEAAGITHWMMIHDSFGTHAGQVSLLRDVLREQFVKLYEIDVLSHLREQVIAQTGHDPGPPPERGGFDLDTVHHSAYIFS